MNVVAGSYDTLCVQVAHNTKGGAPGAKAALERNEMTVVATIGLRYTEGAGVELIEATEHARLPAKSP